MPPSPPDACLQAAARRARASQLSCSAQVVGSSAGFHMFAAVSVRRYRPSLPMLPGPTYRSAHACDPGEPCSVLRPRHYPTLLLSSFPPLSVLPPLRSRRTKARCKADAAVVTLPSHHLSIFPTCLQTTRRHHLPSSQGHRHRHRHHATTPSRRPPQPTSWTPLLPPCETIYPAYTHNLLRPQATRATHPPYPPPWPSSILSTR